MSNERALLPGLKNAIKEIEEAFDNNHPTPSLLRRLRARVERIENLPTLPEAGGILCGQNNVGLTPAETGGCGEPIALVEVYRCADCGLPFHREHIRYHFGAQRHGDNRRRLALPEATPISDQGAQAIALLALLGQTAPIQRWKEYEDRGEERIPCFIQVETAKAIAEFFPDSLTPQLSSSKEKP